MGSRRDVLVIAGILAAVILIALLTGNTAAARSGGADPRASTYLSTRLGAGALHDVLAELKIPTERRMQAFVDADSIRGPLVVIA